MDGRDHFQVSEQCNFEERFVGGCGLGEECKGLEVKWPFKIVTARKALIYRFKIVMVER